MGRRESSEVNAGSMADIAFLLLIFFLVTSEMTREAGMFQLLPEKTDIEQDPPKKIKDRNVIEVLVNNNNLVLFENELVVINDIPNLVKEMILNEGNDDKWPESRAVTKEELQKLVERNRLELEEATEAKRRSIEKKLRKSKLRVQALEVFGDYFRKSSHVINMQATQGASYETYIQLKDKLKQAYTSLRNDLARKKLQGRGWEDLTLDEKEMLKMVYKENISEAPVIP